MKATQGQTFPACVALMLFCVREVIGYFIDHESDPASARNMHWQGSDVMVNSERNLYSGLKRTSQSKDWRRKWRKEDKNLRKVFDCVGGPANDISMSRWPHEKPLYKDQYICSDKKPYVFGLTAEGDLLWIDVKRAKIRRFFQMPDPPAFDNTAVPVALPYNSSLEHFQISVEAHLQVYDGNQNLVWDLEPRVDDITNTSCLEGYDCPYLHLHPDGVNVLNYRDPYDYYYWDEWNVLRAYRYDN